MMFSPEIAAAARHCLDRGINFAVYAMPGSDSATFVADDGEAWTGDEDELNGFFLNTFLNKLPMPVVIRPQWDCHSVIGHDGPGITAISRHTSTPREKYLHDIACLTEELKRDGGKTVISRVICGDDAGIDWVTAADRYFDAYRMTFRFLYHTRLTGAWLGASPEIILSHDRGDNTVTTMALAGTRVRSDKPWDAKNVEEHRFVTKYIEAVLRAAGAVPHLHDAENIAYGDIEHLCHRITAGYDGSILRLLNMLSPTPALAGTPLDAALRHIAAYESHSRDCYGGYVGVSDSSGLHAYVNLRSVNFDKTGYCIYAGGGITAASTPADEWAETEAKVRRLQSIIKDAGR